MKYKLEDICEMQSGGTPRRGESLFYDGNIPWAKITDFENSVDGVLYETEEHITEFGLASINNRIFKEGTLLLAMYGSVGKTVIAGKPLSTNQAILGINPRDKDILNIKFLKYWFEHNKGFIYSQGKGATLHNISLTIVKKQEINLPDIHTQNKIVSILDKASALITKREQTIQLLDELLKATFLDMFGDPVINPKQWSLKAFSNVGKFMSGGTPSKDKPEYWNGVFPWISPKDMKRSNLRNSIDHISEIVFEETSLKKIAPNSILIVVRGMILAHSFPVGINRVPVAINQDMKAIIPSKEYDPDFLLTCLTMMKDWILQFVSSAAHGTKKLNTDSFEKILIPCPPPLNQAEFVKILAKVKRLKKEQSDLLEQSKVLFNSILQRAFNGDLNFNIDAELDSLLDAIDLQKKENDLSKIAGDEVFLKRLIDKLNTQEFKEKDQYDKAKHGVFQLLKEGKKVTQEYNEQTKSIQLALL